MTSSYLDTSRDWCVVIVIRKGLHKLIQFFFLLFPTINLHSAPTELHRVITSFFLKVATQTTLEREGRVEQRSDGLSVIKRDCEVILYVDLASRGEAPKNT